MYIRGSRIEPPMTTVAALFRRRPKPAVAAAPVEAEDEARYGKIDLKLVRRMLGALRPFRHLYALGLALGLVHIGLEMAGPKFMERLINFTLGWVGSHPASNRQVWAGNPARRAGDGRLGRGDGRVDRVPAVHDPGHGRGRRAGPVRHPPATVRPPPTAQHELLRPHEAGPDHQPVHERRGQHAGGQRLGAVQDRRQRDADRDRHGHDRHHRLAPVPGHRLARPDGRAGQPDVHPSQLGAVADRPRGVDPGQHQPGREHHRHPRRHRLRPPDAQPRRVQPPADRQHDEQRPGRPPQRRLPAVAGRDQVPGPAHHFLLRRLPGPHPPHRRRRRGRDRHQHVLGLVHEPHHRFGELLQPVHASPGQRRAGLQPARHAGRRDRRTWCQATAADRRPGAVRPRDVRLQRRPAGCCTTSASRPSRARWSPSSAPPAAARAASSA